MIRVLLKRVVLVAVAAAWVASACASSQTAGEAGRSKGRAPQTVELTRPPADCSEEVCVVQVTD